MVKFTYSCIIDSLAVFLEGKTCIIDSFSDSSGGKINYFKMLYNKFFSIKHIYKNE